MMFVALHLAASFQWYHKVKNYPVDKSDSQELIVRATNNIWRPNKCFPSLLYKLPILKKNCGIVGKTNWYAMHQTDHVKTGAGRNTVTPKALPPNIAKRTSMVVSCEAPT